MGKYANSKKFIILILIMAIVIIGLNFALLLDVFGII